MRVMGVKWRYGGGPGKAEKKELCDAEVVE
jgi:hypothetical protein